MERFVDNNLRISVRNLVEFILRSGDIDNRIAGSFDNNAMVDGGKLHRKIQKSMPSEYRAEVPLKHFKEYERFSITIEGRADGIMRRVNPQEDECEYLIDEIKTTYTELIYIKEMNNIHRAQVLCYAYMFCCNEGIDEIDIQITYANLDTESTVRYKERVSFEYLTDWFDEVMDKYYTFANYLYISRINRKESIDGLEFPFEYRKGQRSMAVTVYKAIESKRNLFVQAPTGIGKTMSTIFPAVKAVGEKHGDRIFYLTAKTITRTVAEESFRILREHGLSFSTITLTAKDKMCICDETNCNPEYCERAKGHYDRVNEAILDVITTESDINRETVSKYAEKHKVCPFELGLDISNWVDGIICDYNYVFDPKVYLKRYFADGVQGDYIFLVDEAHNLVERAREMYSADLCKEDILAVKKIIEEKDEKLAKRLEKINKIMLAYKRECNGYAIIDTPGTVMVDLTWVKGRMEKLLDAHKEFDNRDIVLQFYFDIGSFIDIFDRVDENYEIYTHLGVDGKFRIKLLCVNPSYNLEECMMKGNSTIMFSATLLPINYYKELLTGKLDDDAIYIESPFEQKNRFLFMTNDISSKYTRRGKNEYQKITDVIKSMGEANTGNYIVFFPSYKLMMDVYGVCIESSLDKTFDFELQSNNMNENEREEFLLSFGKKRDRTYIAFCVLGGIFSEGIDLTAEKLIGTLVVGTGLPMVCDEREIIKNYFDKNGENGFDFSYRFPGMNKVLQASGRVIRTANDVGVIGLIDERFEDSRYKNLFPREWNDCKVMRGNDVKKRLKDFWNSV